MAKAYVIKERYPADGLPTRWVVRWVFTNKLLAWSTIAAAQETDAHAVFTVEQWDTSTGQYEKELEVTA